MTPVVAVESNEALRGTLDVILTDVGHLTITNVTTGAAALDYLAACPEGVVAVCSNSHHDHHVSTAVFVAVMADKR